MFLSILLDETVRGSLNTYASLLFYMTVPNVINIMYYKMITNNKRGTDNMKIFLSPSNQRANVGAYTNSNECVQCTAIALQAKKFLDENYDCEVIVATESDNMKTRAQYANSIGANVYVAIHTNAFNDKSVYGTETFYYSTDEKGRELAAALLEAVGSIVGKKRRARQSDSLIELNTPTCTRAYIEVDFHSNPERARWIQANTQLIGNTIAKTIAEHMKLKVKTNAKDVDLESVVIDNLDKVLEILKNNINTSTKRLYRVQAGAFALLKDAEDLSQKLTEAGFTNVIRYE